MNEGLRPQYLKFLSRRGLKPPSIPPNWEETAKVYKDRMVLGASAKGDHYMIEAIEESYKKAVLRDLRDIRHPSDRMLCATSDWVEDAIRRSTKYDEKFLNNVYVGDFPTGAFNAHVTPVKGGYLVLVNSGAMVLIRTVYSLLASLRDLNHISADAEVVSVMGEVFDSYNRNGDPMYGPLNQAFGSDAIVATVLTRACDRFMIAHEYAHILAGHLVRQRKRLCSLSTPAGSIKVTEKDYQMELEADLIAYELLIGTDQPNQIDTTYFRQIESGDQSELIRALEQAALIVAPLLFLAIDLLTQRVASSFKDPNAGFERSKTHPSTVERIDQIIRLVNQAPPQTTGLLKFGVALRTIGDFLEQKTRGGETPT